MIYEKQLIQHDPDNGQYGDCYRTALGCILNMKPEDVPHFYDGSLTGDEVHRKMREWLASKGMSIFIIAYNGDCTLNTVLTNVSANNPDTYYMLTGASKRGTNHCVVCCNDEIIHDPTTLEPGIVGPCDDSLYWVDFIIHGISINK